MLASLTPAYAITVSWISHVGSYVPILQLQRVAPICPLLACRDSYYVNEGAAFSSCAISLPACLMPSLPFLTGLHYCYAALPIVPTFATAFAECFHAYGLLNISRSEAKYFACVFSTWSMISKASLKV
jgi:hypothetical protein